MPPLPDIGKPLCRCITEVRPLHAAAKRAGLVTQMGNQGRAGEGIRLVREWVDAIRGGPACGSNFDYAAPLTELVLLGVVAIRAQSRLAWDSTAMKITNLADANRLLGPGYDYLPGWDV